MVQETTKQLLQNSKNLLAFSAGGDSTALLYILLENNISFDLAIVDYGLRDQSKAEVAYAKELAQKYGLNCFVKTAEKIDQNFEANARAIRYEFFEELIEAKGYENLLTAHHLGDRLEWFLMQFCKGSGCVELRGMQEIEKRKSYRLIRPLLRYEKQELLEYLTDRNILYFEDETNKDESYKRNFFRHNFAEPLLEHYKEGIKKSFEYISKDVTALIEELEIKVVNKLAYFPTKDKRTNGVYIDKYLKSVGHIITANERLEIASKHSVVVGRKYVIEQTQNYVFIAPYIDNKVIDKKLKERFRVMKVPEKLRAYLAGDTAALELLSLLFE